MIPLIGIAIFIIALATSSGGDKPRAKISPKAKDDMDLEIDRVRAEKGLPPVEHPAAPSTGHVLPPVAWGPDDAVPGGSPLQNVPVDGWVKYVAGSILNGDLKHVGSDGRLGLFLAGPAQLQEDGFMKGADWVPPFSKARFLSSRRDQYEAFARQAKRHQKAILARATGALGKKILLDRNTAGPVATLSGLMAVARLLGLAGMERWIKGKQKAGADEAKAIFLKLNGLF